MTLVAAERQDDQASILESVIEIIRPYAKSSPDQLDAATPIEKLGVDSFDFVEIVFAIEEKYGIEISYNVNSTFAELVTIGKLADEVAALVAAKKAG